MTGTLAPGRGRHVIEDRAIVGYHGSMATAIPHLEPDPFDKVVEKVLSDPALVSELDEQHAAIDRGDAKLHRHDEARRIVGLPPQDAQ